MCNGNEEWWKVWREIDLQFQNWHKEFDEFWPKQSKVSIISNLMGFFWPKYKIFERKKYRGVMSHDPEESCKIWINTDLCFGKWHEEFGKFLPKHSKVSKFGLDGISLSKVENVWS